MWTLALVSTGITGMWLAAKHWYGWLLNLVNEVLWLGYAIHTHDHALAIMAVVWGTIAVRNTVVTRKAQAA